MMTPLEFVKMAQARLDVPADGIPGPITLAAFDAKVPPRHSVPQPNRGRLAIVVGHNSVSQGAVRVTDGRSEYDWNGELAEMIRAQAPDRVSIFRRQSGGGYHAEIARAYAAVAQWQPSAVLELHFNAYHVPSANGCETLHSGSAASAGLAQAVQSATLAALGTKSRGLVPLISSNLRGGASVHALRNVPIVITEPYFGSNAQECNIAQARMATLAQAQFRAAMQFIGA